MGDTLGRGGERAAEESVEVQERSRLQEEGGGLQGSLRGHLGSS